MNNILTGIVLILLFSACNKKNDNNIIWADEFNGSGHPDSTKWGYEKAFVRNKEAQYYTEKRLENVRVEDGCLIIETSEDNYNGNRYTSGSINTLGKFDFEDDFRIEVKAKLPEGKGIWPAIWMMGTNISSVGWPKCSELDIMEFVGHTPNTIYSTMHWFDEEKEGHNSKGANIKISDLNRNFHVFSLERRGDSIKSYVDDNCYFQFQVSKSSYQGSFSSPLYLLINTALGGSWGGEIDKSIFPQKFIVDYVRVYSL